MMRPSPGQAIVEFAIVLPVFLMMTLGVVDFGRAIWAYNTVAFLARDGARWGVAAGHSTNDIEAHVAARCTPELSTTCYRQHSSTTPVPALLPPGTAAIYVTRGTCGSTSAPVVVTVEYDFQLASMLVAQLWGGGDVSLRASSQMYVEAGPVGGCAS